TIDVLLDLTGTEAAWHGISGGSDWSGWLPHLDLTAARALTSPSEEHARLFQNLSAAGVLSLRAQLDLWLMLRPAIQPGAKLDYEYAPETVTVVFQSSSKLDLKPSSDFKTEQVSDHEIRITIPSREGHWAPIELTLATGQGE